MIMDKLKVLPVWQSPLRTKQQGVTLPITDEILESMVKLMIHHQGVGLSANQVGISERFAIIDLTPFINNRELLLDVQKYDSRGARIRCLLEDLPIREIMGKPILVIINPVYSPLGDTYEAYEGCLSITKMSDVKRVLPHKVVKKMRRQERISLGKSPLIRKKRYMSVRASFTDLDGEPNKFIFSLYLAQIFQHETDHLDGLSILD